jgi:hypothetical protein
VDGDDSCRGRSQIDPYMIRVDSLRSSMPQTPPAVGRVVATELKPSTPHQFYFWTARESPIGIGAIVVVEAPGRTVHGIVTEGFA